MELSSETKTKLFLNSNAVGLRNLEIQEDEYAAAFKREIKKPASRS